MKRNNLEEYIVTAVNTSLIVTAAALVTNKVISYTTSESSYTAKTQTPPPKYILSVTRVSAEVAEYANITAINSLIHQLESIPNMTNEVSIQTYSYCGDINATDMFEEKMDQNATLDEFEFLARIYALDNQIQMNGEKYVNHHLYDESKKTPLIILTEDSNKNFHTYEIGPVITGTGSHDSAVCFTVSQPAYILELTGGQDIFDQIGKEREDTEAKIHYEQDEQSMEKQKVLMQNPITRAKIIEQNRYSLESYFQEFEHQQMEFDFGREYSYQKPGIIGGIILTPCDSIYTIDFAICRSLLNDNQAKCLEQASKEYDTCRGNN